MVYEGVNREFYTYERFAEELSKEYKKNDKTGRPGMGLLQPINPAGIVTGIIKLGFVATQCASEISENFVGNDSFLQDWEKTGVVVSREKDKYSAFYIDEVSELMEDGYRSIVTYDKTYPQCGLVIKEGLVTSLIIPPIYDEKIVAVGDGLYRVCKDGHYGYINSKGEVIIKPGAYEEVQAYSQGYITVKVDDKRYRIIEVKNGEKIRMLPNCYEWASDFVNGFCVVEEKGKEGLIDLQGNYTLQPEYDAISSVSQNVVTVIKNGKIEEIPLEGKA